MEIILILHRIAAIVLTLLIASAFSSLKQYLLRLSARLSEKAALRRSHGISVPPLSEGPQVIG